MTRRHWWTWLTDGAAAAAGGLAAAGLIIGLGWGEHSGWRLVAAAAIGLVVAGLVCEWPAKYDSGASPPDDAREAVIVARRSGPTTP
ncbi:hypothetical protein [Streptomyces misionensis]|uniref:hypothetical protein n=1 Tax=Streptomyces misionensis TaxID=67331 RepID=UPI0033AC8C7D